MERNKKIQQHLLLVNEKMSNFVFNNKMTIMKKNIILILFMLLSIIPSFGQVKIGGTHHLAEEVYKPYGYYNQPIKKTEDGIYFISVES